MGKAPLPLLVLAVVAAPLASANDFPTRARVEYVIACMEETKAPPTEAMYKCSCAIDAIAEKVRYSEWVDLSTVANGITIASHARGIIVTHAYRPFPILMMTVVPTHSATAARS